MDAVGREACKSPDDIKLSDDSGNLSSTSTGCSSDASCFSVTDKEFANVLQEKEHALLLALKDLRKLRSELERLSKSEQWYKQELKSQKSTRLETLERLYTQERKYMKENQRLQKECLRLFTKCTELEWELEVQREKPNLRAEEHVKRGGKSDDDFTLNKQLSLINDQDKLIEVLRNQKRHLLEDVQRLGLEHNEKMLAFQRAMANMELENNKVTGKCMQLLNDKKELESKLRNKDDTLEKLSAEKAKSQKVISDLNETLQAQEKLLALKEQQFLELREQFNANLKGETNPDAVHRLSIDFQRTISAKTNEIAALKVELQQYQEELAAMTELEAKHELSQRIIEQLHFDLDAQNLEYKNLLATESAKTQQLEELGVCFASLRNEKEDVQKCLRLTQDKVRALEQDLIDLHKQYADMCAISESSKFQLELQEIESRKLQCQTECDAKEIQRLRERLKENLMKTATLSQSISATETELQAQNKQVHEYRQRLLQVELVVDQSKPDVSLSDEREMPKQTELVTEMCQKQLDYTRLTTEIGVQTEHNSHEDLRAPTTALTANESELPTLKEQIVQLETKVQEIDSKKQNILTLFNGYLNSQKDKEKRVDSLFADWEELSKAILSMQKLEEGMKQQLQLKNAELEELNSLFALQNEELHNLQQLAYRSECQRDEDFKLIKRTFQNDFNALQQKYAEDTEKLCLTNKQLQGDLNAAIVCKSQMDELQLKLEDLLEERASTILKVKELEVELAALKQKLPSSATATEMAPSTSNGEECVQMMNAVMADECVRKLEHCDLPLVVRNLKRMLRQDRITRRSEDMLIKQCKDLRLKNEDSQTRIKALECALELERKKFESSDMGKTVSREHSEHEVANLIDDYKKLIQQSADATGRARTSAILDLIERSNRCMPSLDTLDEAISDFRLDIQQLTDVLSTNEACASQAFDNGIPSLMDELRAVTEQFKTKTEVLF